MFLQATAVSVNAVVNRQVLEQAGIPNATATQIATGITSRDANFRLDPVDGMLAALWWSRGIVPATIATNFVGSVALPVLPLA